MGNHTSGSDHSFYRAALEGNAQSSMSKKDKMADGAPRKLCVSYPRFNGTDFAGKERVISALLVDRFGSPFGTNTNLLRGVIGPISTRNCYLHTVFDDVVSLRGSYKTMPFHGPQGKSFNLLQFSPCV